MTHRKQSTWVGLALLLTFALVSNSCMAGDGDKAVEAPKVEKKEDKAKEKPKQSNRFTRFWIHTVGGPMARGMKDGTRIVYKGLKSGAHKVKTTFKSSD